MFRAIAGTFVTKAWTALLGILALPLYVRFLGPEAFGIVSFVTVVQSAVNLLDFGLSSSITRQVAIHQAANEREEKIHSIRTLELVYWAIGVLICTVLLCGCQFAAVSWLRPKTLSPATVHQALIWASLAVASLWPMTFYSGALMGMARYQSANLINASSLTLRLLGGAAVAWLTGGDLKAFFVWQFAASFVPVVIAAGLVWRAAGVRMNSRARWNLIREQRGFLGGMAFSTGSMLLFTQMDKIILSHLFPLSEFGAYSLAWTAAGVFYLFYNPVAAIGLPRFTTMLAKGDDTSLARTYQIASQLVAVGVLPTAVILTLFAHPVLTLWLHEKAIVENTCPLLQVLAPFSAIGALAYMPAVLQWAHGWTAPTSSTNFVATLLLGPSLVIAYRWGGASAAIFAWGILRVGQAVAQLCWMHRRVLPASFPAWLSKAVAAPAAASLIIGVIAQRLLETQVSGLQLGIVWIMCAAAAFLTTADLRKAVVGNWFGLSRRRYPSATLPFEFPRPEAQSGGSK